MRLAKWLLAFGLSTAAWNLSPTRLPCEEPENREAVATNKTLLSNTADEDVVRKLAHEFAAAFQTENPTTLSRLEEILADDLIQVRSIGEVVKSKKANLTLYGDGIKEIREYFRTMTVDYDISMVKCFTDGAVVFGKLVLDGRLKDGDTPFRRELCETMVFRKDGAQWLLILEHSTSASAGEPTTARQSAGGLRQIMEAIGADIFKPE